MDYFRGSLSAPLGTMCVTRVLTAALMPSHHADYSHENSMSKARDLINAHLYPVLATFAVIYGAIQIAPIAQQARNFNTCVQQGVERNRKDSKDPNTPQLRALSVAFCNGEGRAPRPPLPQVEGDVFF